MEPVIKAGRHHNLAVQLEIEYAAYLDYKVSAAEMTEVITAVKKQLPQNKKYNANFQVLMWWKLHGTAKFPIVARVARSTLCVAAASSKSENNFSDAGNTLTKKRNSLKPHTVNDLMFMRSNIDICL